MSDDTPSPLRERVAEEIRVQLARRNISAAELARRTGYKQPYLSRRMVGEVSWDLDDLEKIAGALEVEVGELLPAPAYRDDRPPPRSRNTYGSSGPAARMMRTNPAALLAHAERPSPDRAESGQPGRADRRPAIQSYRHVGVTTR